MRHPPVVEAQPGAAVGHLAAIDVVRFLTVGAVILVHSTSAVVGPGSYVGNGVLALAHVTRSVFIGLSALVLTYSFDRKPLAWKAFGRRRYPLVVVPYVVWSAVYVLANGNLASPLDVTGRFVVDLFDGGASYHLYFILLTLQLYLVFPALMAALRRWPAILRPALVGAGVFQISFDAAVHYGWRPPILGIWLSHPGSWLPSYTLYIVAGVATARNLEPIGTWIDTHRRHVTWLFVGSVALALCSYGFDLEVMGYSALKAAEVFQPSDVLVAAAALLGEYALGMWFTQRTSAQWLRRLRTSSDASFGVYLAHPLLLGAVVSLATSSGLVAWGSGWPDAAVELMVGLALVPLLYASSFVLIAVARRSPASLALSGRPLLPGLRRDGIVRIVAVVVAVSTSAVVISACGAATAPAAPVASGLPTTTETSVTTVPATTTSSSTSTSTTSTTQAASAALLSSSKSGVDWVSKTNTIAYGGTHRSYLEFRPASILSSKIPVLVELAGCCYAITDEVNRANFRAVAGPAILVYPYDVAGHWNAGACCGKGQIDDVGFVATVVADVRAQNSDASSSSAYLAGYSNGAKLATRIACDLPNLFTAVAVYGATRVSDCTGPPAASILFMAGTADPEVAVSGTPVSQDGYTEPTVDQIAASYRTADGCSDSTSHVTAGTASATVWNSCRDGRRVGIELYAGQNHGWPEATATTPSAQQIMWNWFAGFS